MRTVFVHLRNATMDQVEEFLDRTYPSPKGSGWIYSIDGDPCLYIDFYRDLNSEAEPEEIVNLVTALGGHPTVSVGADVSGRHPGDLEVGEFVRRFLTEFEGVAQDDFTEGFWTLDDIQLERKKPSTLLGSQVQRAFFDYR